MKARIEVAEWLCRTRGGPRSQRCVDAVRALVDGGGTGTSARSETKFVRIYELDGPDHLVRDAVTALMDFNLAGGDR